MWQDGWRRRWHRLVVVLRNRGTSQAAVHCTEDHNEQRLHLVGVSRYTLLEKKCFCFLFLLDSSTRRFGMSAEQLAPIAALAEELNPAPAVSGKRVGRVFVRFTSRAAERPFADTEDAASLSAVVRDLVELLSALGAPGAAERDARTRTLKSVIAALRDSPCSGSEAAAIVHAVDAAKVKGTRVNHLEEIRVALRLGDGSGAARASSSSSYHLSSTSSANRLYTAIREPWEPGNGIPRTAERCRLRVESALRNVRDKRTAKLLRGSTVDIFGSAVSGFGISTDVQLATPAQKGGGRAKKTDRRGGRSKRGGKSSNGRESAAVAAAANARDVDLCVRIGGALTSAEKFDAQSDRARAALAAAAARWPAVSAARARREGAEAAHAKRESRHNHVAHHSGGRSKIQAVERLEAQLAELGVTEGGREGGDDDAEPEVRTSAASKSLAKSMRGARTRLEGWEAEVAAALSAAEQSHSAMLDAIEAEDAAMAAVMLSADDGVTVESITRTFEHSTAELLRSAKGKKNASDKVINSVARALRSCNSHAGGFEWIRTITNARVPLVKAVDCATERAVDIIVNRQLGVFNSRMLRSYALLDSRAHALGLIVKAWAKSRKIAGEQCLRISLNSLALFDHQNSCAVYSWY